MGSIRGIIWTGLWAMCHLAWAAGPSSHTPTPSDTRGTIKQKQLAPIPDLYTPYSITDFSADLQTLRELAQPLKKDTLLSDYAFALQKILSRSQNWYCQDDTLINLHTEARDILYSHPGLLEKFNQIFATRAEKALARILNQNKLDREAVSDIAYAYRGTPASKSALFMLTKSYLDKGEYELAGIYSEVLVQDFPGYEAWPLYWQAQSHLGNLGKLNKSIEAFKRKYPTQTTIRSGEIHLSIDEQKNKIFVPIAQWAANAPPEPTLSSFDQAGADEEVTNPYHRAIRFQAGTPPANIVINDYFLSNARCFESNEVRGFDDYVTQLLTNSEFIDKVSTISLLGEKAVPTVRKLLNSSNSAMQITGFGIIEKLGNKAKKLIPTLLTLVNQQNIGPKDRAVVALGHIGPDAHTTVPILIRMVGNTHSTVSIHAENAIMQIGEKAIPHLIKALDDAHWETRYQAAMRLTRFGEKAETAIGALVVKLDDDDSQVQLAAQWALRYMGQKAINPVAKYLISSKDLKSAYSAGSILRNIGGTAVDKLAEALKCENKFAQTGALHALWDLGSQAAPATKALAASLSDFNDENKILAIGILSQIGPDAHDALPTLVKISESSIRNEKLQNSVSSAIQAITKPK